ncbi:MAG: hypothetical protein OXF02_01165 [Simkaniaceae bacterium]|nr:hypothetical protein [Simkaniaceae bacterium]
MGMANVSSMVRRRGIVAVDQVTPEPRAQQVAVPRAVNNVARQAIGQLGYMLWWDERDIEAILTTGVYLGVAYGLIMCGGHGMAFVAAWMGGSTPAVEVTKIIGGVVSGIAVARSFFRDIDAIYV